MPSCTFRSSARKLVSGLIDPRDERDTISVAPRKVIDPRFTNSEVHHTGSSGDAQCRSSSKGKVFTESLDRICSPRSHLPSDKHYTF